MLNLLNLNWLKGSLERTLIWFIAFAFLLSTTVPFAFVGQAEADTLSSRSVTLSTSQADVTGVTYSFAFTTTATFDIQSIVFQFCNTPLGTCVLPGTDSTPAATETLDAAHVTASLPGSHFTGTTADGFAENTTGDAGDCDESDGGSGVATMYCVSRTQTTDEIAGAKTFTISNITNPIIAQTPTAKNNEQVYVRISLYSDTGWTTLTDDGIVAAAIVNQLTVTGRVQERLVFCAFALDDVAGSNDASVGDAGGDFPTRCSSAEAMASSSVDIGVVDNSTIAEAPVDNTPPTSLGNDRFGALLVNTNASGGVALTYYATAAGSGTNELRAFRVAGATCNVSGTDLTDQCFVSASDTAATPDDFTALQGAGTTERFGMQVVCITNNNTISAGTTSNLGSGGVSSTPTSNQFMTLYANGDSTQGDLEDNGTDDCENDVAESHLYGWNDNATAQFIIGASNVVDDEMVKLRFGAFANATTPTGTYTVASTFIATPTF